MPENGHVGERLSAYLDDELEPKVRAAVAAHLAACATCAGELEELRQLQASLLETSVPDPGPAYWASFTNRVQVRLSSAAADAPSRWLERLSSWLLPSGGLGWVRLAGAFATVTLVAYLGMRGFRPESAGRIEPLQQGRVGSPPASTPGTPPAETAQDTRSQEAVSLNGANRDASEQAKEKRSAENALAKERATTTRPAENTDALKQSGAQHEFSQEPTATASRPVEPAPVAGGAAVKPQVSAVPEARVEGAPATAAPRASAPRSRDEAAGKFASRPPSEPRAAGGRAQKSEAEAANEPANKDLTSPSPAVPDRQVEPSLKMRAAPVPGTAAEEQPSPVGALSPEKKEALHATQLTARA